jgi:3-dehydroquinate synthase
MTNCQQITVGLGERSYPILVGEGILSRLDSELSKIAFPKQIAVVTNDLVGKIYGADLLAVLERYCETIKVISIPDGEEYKTLGTLEMVFTDLINNGFDRSCGFIALGGGVVGDLVGFAASCYLRGVPFIQIPTTLLAQVDSSVGGKTAVNHNLGKNLIGAFYQPQLVLIDVAMLKTLSPRELKAGLAEVVKYGVIRDQDFFVWLEGNTEKLLSMHPDSLIQAIMKSCQIKANIVESDEKESSLRAILNYGHTFGHAVEQLSGYGVLRHGEAVAIGMLVAAKISLAEGLCSAKDVLRLSNLLRDIGLPVDIPPFTLDEYLAAMARDKKVHQGTLRFILNRGIGDCLIRDIVSPRDMFSGLLQTPDDNSLAMAEDVSGLLGKIAAYTEILTKDPRSTVFVSLSEAYRQIGMLDDALEIAMKGTSSIPGFCPGFTALGRVFAQQGELTKAAEAFDRALELESGNLLALKGLAKVRHRQGCLEQAKSLLLRALELDPEDSIAKKLLAMLGPKPDGLSLPEDATYDPFADVGAVSGPQPIPTETVADLYRKQGLVKEAAAIYRDILRIDPQRESVRTKLVELQQSMAAKPIDKAFPQDLIATGVDQIDANQGAGPDYNEIELTESAPKGMTPITALEQWLVSIERRRAHVQ